MIKPDLDCGAIRHQTHFVKDFSWSGTDFIVIAQPEVGSWNQLFSAHQVQEIYE